MAFTFQINDDNTVHVFADGFTEPVLVQDVAPDGKAWKSKAEATRWAESYVGGVDETIASGVAELEAFAKAIAETPDPTPES